MDDSGKESKQSDDTKNDTTSEQEIEGGNQDKEALKGDQEITVKAEDDVDNADDVPLDPVVLDQLTEGLLAHFLPEGQKAKATLGELTENQRILIETIQQENSKFKDCQSMENLTSTMQQARQYHSKLVQIKREMVHLMEKSSKLKKRAIKLQQSKQKDALQREQQRERELERERQLIAKPVKKGASGIL